MTKVFFVGAGPGDPELITVKGKRIVGEAAYIIYTGSLVNEAVLMYKNQDAKVYNSASMDRLEIEAIIRRAIEAGQKVVRLHTGDPSLYGAIQEQIEWLEEEGIGFEVVPGVSSFSAAAAALKREYTLPGVSQTLVITRLQGRTAGASRELIGRLASKDTSLCFFLSVHMLEDVVSALRENLPGNTPAAVVFKASWPQQEIIRGSLDDIASLVREAEITKTALILVGGFLTGKGEKSKLYDPDFSHGYR